MSGRLYDDNYLKGPADWIISVTVKEWQITPKKPSFKYRNMTFLLLQDFCWYISLSMLLNCK